MAKDHLFAEEVKWQAICKTMRSTYCTSCKKSELFCKYFCVLREKKPYQGIHQHPIVDSDGSQQVAKIQVTA